MSPPQTLSSSSNLHPDPWPVEQPISQCPWIHTYSTLRLFLFLHMRYDRLYHPRLCSGEDFPSPLCGGHPRVKVWCNRSLFLSHTHMSSWTSYTLSWAFSSCCLVAGLTEGPVWGLKVWAVARVVKGRGSGCLLLQHEQLACSLCLVRA